MKTALFAVLFVALSLFAAEKTADESHGWAVVYRETVVDPTRSYAMYCPTNPECNTVYKDVEKTVWFHTRDEAFGFLNGYYDAWLGMAVERVYLNSNEPVPPRPMKEDRIVGIFECKRLAIHLAKIGTHKISVQEPKEVDADIQEWKP